ncbi:MAG: very short patch repair endonuclease [Ilumatobacter sp.]|uniref:very short patch repair endonuclease n=1 Tax=Ilumatobacter sp. TaxID=1967498 RepID=UPI0032982301
MEPLDENIRDRFRKQRRRDTKPEVALRSALHRQGLRFRVDRKVLPGMRSRPDIVFGPAKVAVFVDGCFWHRCPEHGTRPKNNQEWWDQKLDANVARDRRVDAELREAGWEVIRFWEHEDPLEAAERTASVVDERRRRLQPATL